MPISRRDFLKLTATITASAVARPGLGLLPKKLSADPNAQNVLVIVFDAWSAKNINFYGYPRETMPKLTRLLERATVYHNHHASSNFTTPGTTSLLTGRHVWEHLAIILNDYAIPRFSHKNLFSYFDDYFTLAYSHNPHVYYALKPFLQDIDSVPPRETLFVEDSLIQSSPWFTTLMANDPDTATLLKSRLADSSLDGYLYSLLFPSLLGQDRYEFPEDLIAQFPNGVPGMNGQFILEDAVDWTAKQANTIQQPFLAYIHLLPPHGPYRTRKDFINAFANDGFAPANKPQHPLIIPDHFISPDDELGYRQYYDEFLLYVDSEFERLFTQLEQQGTLDNTWVVLTSDHGEMFERRTKEHASPYLFDPLVRVPLVIFEPGQTQRIDVQAPTSCVDVLPTLLHLTNHEIPAGLPGQVLPPFAGQAPNPERTIYAMDARWNQEHEHIKTLTVMMRREHLKAIRYSNYKKYYRDNGYLDRLSLVKIDADPYFEVFDLENDPEEMHNLAEEPSPAVQALMAELEAYYREHIEYPGNDRSS